MAHAAFDTLKFVEKLIAAGVPNNQAKAIAEAQNEAFHEALDSTVVTNRSSAGRNKFKARQY